MRTKFTGLFLIAVILGSMLTSCVTSTAVRMNSDVEGANVTIDGVPIGVTPLQTKMSNAIWEDPDVILKKEGYKDLVTSVKKEVKPVNLVCGIIIWWPSLLWVYGPKKDQNFVMSKAN